MPYALLETIQAFESGGKNISQQVPGATNSSASGIYQVTRTTWNQTIVPATGLARVGGDSQYANVKDLPLSVQEQGVRALINKNGISDYTCTGCNPAFASYVKSHGGESNFVLDGGTVPTDLPGGYVTPTGGGNTAGSSATGSDITGAGSSGLPAISFTSEDGSSSASMPAVSDLPGPLSKPFTWLYKETITGTKDIVSSDIYAMQTAVGTYADVLITLALVCLCIRCLLGRYLVDRFARFVVTVGFVIPFITVGSTLYQTYVVDPVLELPSFWQKHLATQNGIDLAGSNPAAMLDAVYNQTYHVGIVILKATPSWLSMLWNAPIVGTAWIIIAFSLLAVFMAYAIITLLAMILLVIGPVMIPLVLFHVTAPLFHGWVRATITLVLSMLAIDVILNIFLSIMTNLMNALSITGTPDTDIPSVWGCALAMAVMGRSVKYVPSVIAMIGGGVAVSLDSVSRHMSGARAASVAMVPVNAARRYIGMR